MDMDIGIDTGIGINIDNAYHHKRALNGIKGAMVIR